MKTHFYLLIRVEVETNLCRSDALDQIAQETEVSLTATDNCGINEVEVIDQSLNYQSLR